MPTPPLDGLTQTVAVYANTNAGGASGAAHGGTPVNLATVDGQGSVPCLIGFRKATEVDVAMHPGAMRFARVMFGSSVALDQTNVLVWLDPDRAGAARYLYVIGDSWPSTGLPTRYWVVDVVEYPPPSG